REIAGERGDPLGRGGIVRGCVDLSVRDIDRLVRDVRLVRGRVDPLGRGSGRDHCTDGFGRVRARGRCRPRRAPLDRRQRPTVVAKARALVGRRGGDRLVRGLRGGRGRAGRRGDRARGRGGGRG